jgi:hypothetical protein
MTVTLKDRDDRALCAAKFHQMVARIMANRIMSMNATLRILLTGPH